MPSSPTSESNVVFKVLALLIRVCEVPVSNIGPETGNSD